jgi:hypothetical protein
MTEQPKHVGWIEHLLIKLHVVSDGCLLNWIESNRYPIAKLWDLEQLKSHTKFWWWIMPTQQMHNQDLPIVRLHSPLCVDKTKYPITFMADISNIWSPVTFTTLKFKFLITYW